MSIFIAGSLSVQLLDPSIVVPGDPDICPEMSLYLSLTSVSPKKLETHHTSGPCVSVTSPPLLATQPALMSLKVSQTRCGSSGETSSPLGSVEPALTSIEYEPSSPRLNFPFAVPVLFHDPATCVPTSSLYVQPLFWLFQF